MKSPAFDLIGVGSPIVDSLARVTDDFILTLDGEKGGMVLVDEAGLSSIAARLPEAPEEAPGGSAGNTAVGAARLGLDVTFLGKLGNDPTADLYRSEFAKAGGDVSRFKSGGMTNARCVSLVTPDSQRTMRTFLGAAATLAPEDVSAADFAGVRHAHIEGYLLFNEALLTRVLESARDAGCSVSLDLASFEVVRAAGERLRPLLEEHVDVVFANEEEAAAFIGGGTDPQTALEELASLCGIAVVKLGAGGSLVRAGGETHVIPPVQVERVVDTTGAGDLWAAGFLSAWLRGQDLATCGRLGSLLGAEVVQIMGAVIPEERWAGIRKAAF